MPKWCNAKRAPLLACLWAACQVACRSPGSQRIVGPDGSAMSHVHFGADQGTCFRIAGEMCPSGYELKPVLTGNDGNFLVRCREPRAVAQVTTACAAEPVTTPPALMYPWPPPGGGTAAERPASPRASPQTEIDLGY